MVSLPAEAGREEELSTGGVLCVVVVVVAVVDMSGEGVCPRKTEPRRESGLWRKEALGVAVVVGLAANMSISIAPATGQREEACWGECQQVGKYGRSDAKPFCYKGMASVKRQTGV